MLFILSLIEIGVGFIVITAFVLICALLFPWFVKRKMWVEVVVSVLLAALFSALFVAEFDLFVEFFTCAVRGPVCLKQTECQIIDVEYESGRYYSYWRVYCLKPDGEREVLIADGSASLVERAYAAATDQLPVCVLHFPHAKEIIEITEGHCK